jgi:predicted RecA/RadA family phage recombinase
MATNYQQVGDVLQYTAGANITSGQVVKVGNLLCIALQDIANGETGPVKRTGVFVVPKVTGAVIAQGESLTWDASVGKFDDNAATPATGDVTGAAAFAFEAAGNGATELAVCFTGVPGTVT